MSLESTPVFEGDDDLNFVPKREEGGASINYTRPLEAGETAESVSSLRALFEKIEVDFSDKTPEERKANLKQLQDRLSELNSDTNLRMLTGGQVERVKDQQELSELISRFILLNTSKSSETIQ